MSEPDGQGDVSQGEQLMKEDGTVEKKEKEVHPVFKAVTDGDVERVRNFFEIENVPIEIQDENGMTPLMHACWKGNKDMVKFLIKQVLQGAVYTSIGQRLPATCKKGFDEVFDVCLCSMPLFRFVLNLRSWCI